MKRRAQLVLGWAALFALLVSNTGPAVVTSSAQAPPHAWTLNEALAQLTLFPGDAYLQYVALQLARRADRFAEVSQRVESLIPDANRDTARARSRDSVDLFSIFTGALAVQESLQLDTMRAATVGRATRTVQTNSTPDLAQTQQGRRRRNTRRRGAAPATATATETPAPQARRADEVVAVAGLKGPTVKSHPWEQLLSGRKPAISPLAYDVPEDFYLLEFHSLSRLLDLMDANDLWGAHLFSQAFKEARMQNVSERLKRQLAVQSEPTLRPFYDLVVQDVAVTGSDPFVREGSDVTLIFRVKEPSIFKARMDTFLDEAQQAHADAKRTTGNYLGVDYVQLQTPLRDLSVIAAEPAPDLHVRSNSLAAFRRVLEAIKGEKTPAGLHVRRLGETAEFAYIRTLMPQGDEAEDGLLYLSDPFIRRLVDPELKLTERRRMLCYNHLRMIGHAAMLYRTEFGKWPSSLAELARTNSSPGQFGEGELSCPAGGQYALSADGTTGVCSHHGHALYLTPNLEIPATQVSGAEADEYEAFLAQYNQYWRTYFDPIALRLKASAGQYRVETLILPLIDNSIYTGLAAALKGEPEPLDALPVPPRNIFSLALRLNKEPLLKRSKSSRPDPDDFLLRELGVGDKILTDLKVEEFLTKGLGNQAGLHVYDSYPSFDLNYSSVLGMIAFMGRMGNADEFSSDLLTIGAALLSLNSPVYVALPVRDERVVDDFLERLDLMVAAGVRRQERGDWFDFGWEFYKFKLSGGQTARAINFSFTPAKLRFFVARVGRGLYVASKPFILEDLAAQQEVAARADADSVGHAMARVRARNWNEVLTDFNLSWAENERVACLDNLGPLADVSRALTSGRAPADVNRAVLEEAERLHAVHFYCPDGGLYTVAPDGKSVSCSVHGTALAPQQPRSPSAASAAGRAMRGLDEATATLTFLPEGLRAVVTIKRK
ncbi:MAG TPA: hypothetical protein VJT74_04125 [Pyrinomonadaceae bacterium]|nr:hypothetical protein [Pyrinomonadaceae bacterium]